jgi:hypothetical protein
MQNEEQHEQIIDLGEWEPMSQHDQCDDLEQIIDLGEWEPMSQQQQPEQILNPDPSDPVIDDWDLGRPSGEYYDVIHNPDPSDPIIDDWNLGWPSMEPSTDPGTIDYDVQDQDAFFFEGF